MSTEYTANTANSAAANTLEADAATSWTPDCVQMLTRWKWQAFVHMYLQDKSSYHFRLIYNCMTFPLIGLTSLSSSVLLASDRPAVKTVAAVSSIACTVIVALMRQVKPAEQSQFYASTAHRYKALIHRIDSCLRVMPELRPVAAVFIHRVRTELELMLCQQDDPPAWVMRRFERIYGRVEGVLYGDDVAELISQSVKSKKRFHKIMTGASSAGDSSSSMVSTAERATPQRQPTGGHTGHTGHEGDAAVDQTRDDADLARRFLGDALALFGSGKRRPSLQNETEGHHQSIDMTGLNRT